MEGQKDKWEMRKEKAKLEKLDLMLRVVEHFMLKASNLCHGT